MKKYKVAFLGGCQKEISTRMVQAMLKNAHEKRGCEKSHSPNSIIQKVPLTVENNGFEALFVV